MLDLSLEEQFMAGTTLEHCQDVPLKEGMPVPAPEKYVPPQNGRSFVTLPEPDFFPDINVNFLETIELRTSVRQYQQDEPIPVKELSYLLWCTQGVKMALPNGGSMRNVPSAGARHALETYLFVQRVEGLKPGFYRFLPFDHALLPLTDLDKEAFLAAFPGRRMVEKSAVTFVWSAVRDRMTHRYGPRAYRYLFLDAGHVCENLYLAAQTVKTGVCAVGSFDDAALNQALALDGREEFAIYAATAGKPVR